MGDDNFEICCRQFQPVSFSVIDATGKQMAVRIMMRNIEQQPTGWQSKPRTG
jgi:hypothetical protein